MLSVSFLEDNINNDDNKHMRIIILIFKILLYDIYIIHSARLTASVFCY